MKNPVQILNPDIKKFSFVKNNEIDNYFTHDVSSILIDAFNNQSLLNNQFKQKISCMINLLEFSYSDDRVILNNAIDSFLDLSHKSLVNYIQIDLDLNFKNRANYFKSQNQIYQLYNNTILDKNDCWMEDWMEQASMFNLASNTMHLNKYDNDGFCYYTDVTESE